MSIPYNTVLTIAGSDSSAGAGIQADIKSIAANGGYGATVITAITSQSTKGVFEVHPVPLFHVEAQMKALLDDINFKAIKLGMLHSLEVIRLVSRTIEEYGLRNVVLDPVMVSTSGKRLLSSSAIEGLQELISKVTLVTPNIPEAEVLLGYEIDRVNSKKAAKELAKRYGTSVLLKGGHLNQSDVMQDTLYIKEQQRLITIEHPFVQSKNTHGTGCTLSSAIATQLSLGKSLEEAVMEGCNYVNKAIKAGQNRCLGEGKGPLEHCFNASSS